MNHKKSGDRRQFIKATGCVGLSLALAGCSAYRKTTMGISGLYKGLNTEKYLGEVRVETRIHDDDVFTEGPAADSNGDIYFTNIPTSKILKWDVSNKNLSVFRTESNGANGLRFYPNGDLLICEGDSGAITRTNMETGEVTIIANQYNQKRLQAPNDLDFDDQGRIYFSSRAGNPNLEKENMRAVYRVDPDGSIYQLLTEPQIHMPNGILVSPDGKKLYIIEADGGENRNRCILVFDLQEDGSIIYQRTLFNFYPGRSGDGMCIDERGNLYVAAGLHATRNSSETLDTRPGIHVISPNGKLLAFRETPEDTVTNCTFGGKDLKTLYVTCGSYLLSIDTMIPGKQSYAPRG